jgi:hypothetical protein
VEGGEDGKGGEYGECGECDRDAFREITFESGKRTFPDPLSAAEVAVLKTWKLMEGSKWVV